MAYVPRKTYILFNDSKLCLNEYYDNCTYDKIEYAVFRQRIKSYEKKAVITKYILEDAILLNNDEWTTFYGGGKRKEFTYLGNFFKECIGVTFPSLSSFIRTIGEYDNHVLITRRIHNKWDIDSAIFRKTVDTSLGRIYAIRCKLNNLIYVGQTIKTIEERFYEHFKLFNKNKNKNIITVNLYKAFQKYGFDNFYIEILEDNIANMFLKEREDYWINKLDSLNSEYGLNMIPANKSSAGYGKPIIYQGRNYKSSRSAVRSLQKENPNCPNYVIEKRIKNNKPIPQNPRHHSKHPDAGSNLYRRWKALKRHNQLCECWTTHDDSGYDIFKSDMGYPPQGDYILVRNDITQPHSKENSKWRSIKEAREIISGNKIIAFGKTYNTVTSFAKEYNISLSTLIYRLNNGLSPEEAVNPYKKTSSQQHIYDNIVFKSKTQMLKYIAKKYNITIGQAKDRYDRNLPYDHEAFTGNKCIILGKEFNSEKDAVTYFNVSISSYNKKKANGMTPEEAIIYLLKKKDQRQLLLCSLPQE